MTQSQTPHNFCEGGAVIRSQNKSATLLGIAQMTQKVNFSFAAQIAQKINAARPGAARHAALQNV
jgi:hypothetical protein